MPGPFPDRSGTVKQRFGDVGARKVAGMITRTLHRGFDASLALASGTGDFIAPRYRVDASVRTSLLVPNHSLVATVGARRIQSKGPNYSTGFSGGLAWYAGHHVLLDGDVSTDRGYPGSTNSPQYAIGATLYSYKRWYVGAAARQGRGLRDRRTHRGSGELSEPIRVAESQLVAKQSRWIRAGYGAVQQRLLYRVEYRPALVSRVAMSPAMSPSSISRGREIPRARPLPPVARFRERNESADSGFEVRGDDGGSRVAAASAARSRWRRRSRVA